jgi:hypothetical protein
MGRWQTAGDRICPICRTDGRPPTLVTGRRGPAGGNTQSYCTITKNASLVRRIPARSDGAVNLLGEDLAGLLANAPWRPPRR